MASASKRKKSKKKNTMESAAFQRDEIILWVVLAFSIILCLEQFRHRRKRWKQTEFRIFRAVWSGILYLSDRSGTADRIRTIE